MYPPAHSAPARRRAAGRGCGSPARLGSAPHRCPPEPARSGAGGCGERGRRRQPPRRRGWPPEPRSGAVSFEAQRRGCCGGARRGPAAGTRSAGSRRSQERLHGSTRSDRLFCSLPRSLFLNKISLAGGLGFIIVVIVIMILSVIFVVVVAAAAAPVNLSPSLPLSLAPRLFDLSLALCWLERRVWVCFVFFNASDVPSRIRSGRSRGSGSLLAYLPLISSC